MKLKNEWKKLVAQEKQSWKTNRSANLIFYLNCFHSITILVLSALSHRWNVVMPYDNLQLLVGGFVGLSIFNHGLLQYILLRKKENDSA